MIQKRGRRYRVQVKHRGIVVADRSFERRSDALVWEREQKQLMESLNSVHGALHTAARQYSEVEAANSRLFAP